MQEMPEMRVQSLGQEDPLEEGVATHSSILAWRTLQSEDPEGIQSMGILQERILEWVATPSSRGSSQPRDRTQVSRTVGGFFTI